VFDTGTLFTGQGVIAYETLKMINAGMDSNSIKDNIEVMSRLTHAYLLPDDLSHLMRRRDHNDRTTSWMTKTLAGLLDLRPLLSAFRNDTQKVATVRGFDEGLRRSFAYLERRIKAGLLYPTIALSYGGLLNKVPQMPGYAAFKKTADEHGVEVLLASMSVTVGMNVGPGGLTFGFISEEHKLDW
jgi:fatty acid-binding protein DegV